MSTFAYSPCTDCDKRGDKYCSICSINTNPTAEALKRYYNADMAYQKSFTKNDLGLRRKRLTALFAARTNARKILKQEGGV